MENQDFLGELLRGFVLLIGGFGLVEKLGHAALELRAQFLGAGAGDVLALGGAGFDSGAVEADTAQLQALEFAGQFEHGHEGGGYGGGVVPAEGAKGVVNGMRVGGRVAHGHVKSGGALDAAGAEEAVGVAVA